MEETILNLAQNIIGLTFFSVAGGMLIGWYVTFTHYRQKEREREAVEDYKRKKMLLAPESDFTKMQKAMNILQNRGASYHIEWEGLRFDYDEIKEE